MTNREAEARYNLSQDGEAVLIHDKDAGERAPQVLASRQECQEGRCGVPSSERVEHTRSGALTEESNTHCQLGKSSYPHVFRCPARTLAASASLW